MEWPERTVANPDIQAGKPLNCRTCIAVEPILELRASGRTDAEIVRNYPGLTRKDILASLSFVHWMPRSRN